MIPSRGLRWSIHVASVGRRNLQSASRGYSTAPISTARRWASQKDLQPLRRPALPARSPTLYSKPVVRFNSTLLRSEAVSSNAADIAPSDAITPSPLDAATELSAIPERIGYLKELGLDFGWGPTAFVEWLVEHIHVWCGTPWWATIMIAALAVRVALFKPYMGAADASARMASIKHLTEPVTKRMSNASRAGDRTAAMMARAELKEIYAKAGVKAYKAFVPLVQVFLGYGSFRLMRAMANLPVPGLESGGVAWFLDLTVTDPFFIMPLATGATFMLVMKKGGELGTSNLSPVLQKFLTYGLPTLTVAFMSAWPATLQLSFFVSSILSLIQATLFRNPAFRRWAGIVPLPPRPVSSDGATPSISARLNIAPSYQPPSARPTPTSANSTVTPSEKRKGLIGGAVAEVRGMVTEAKKSIDQFAGTAANKPGLRSPADLKQAKAAEAKRKEMLSAQRYAEEEERKERRRAKMDAVRGRKKQ
ncbi:MAG: Mitochondrial inner membrane protein oxa1 [Geoglossum umbratile]|nr:MAG: Mitochondrial inner membrane protein oxa1 [Geoglossum umbratile]